MQFFRFPIQICVAVFATAFANVSSAESDLNISVFGTVGYAVSDDPTTEYVTGEGRDGASDEGSFEVDSRLGLQLDKELTDKFSVTGQALSRQTFNGTFKPRIEWAFLKTQVTNSTVFRIGRIAVPFFMISDFREVGYANTQLRPPEDTYIQAALGSADGIDLTSYLEFGDTLVTAQGFWALRDQEAADELGVEFRDGIGANLSLERGPVRLRFSYIQTRLRLVGDAITFLANATSQAAALEPQLNEFAEDWNGARKKARFFGIGLELDFEPFTVSAEYTKRSMERYYFSSNDAWYLTAAYRIGNFTPYATLSALTQNSKTEIDFPNNPLVEPLRPLTNAYQAADQKSVIAGLRWDFMAGAAIKVQAESISRKILGNTFNRVDGVEGDVPEDVKLFSAVVDFTF